MSFGTTLDYCLYRATIVVEAKLAMDVMVNRVLSSGLRLPLVS